MAFDYLCFFSNGANHQADLAIGNFGVNPFKNSDFDPQSLYRYYGLGSRDCQKLH